MTLRALAFVGALVISSGLITPGTAEARHRHGYGCDHRRADAYYDRSPRYYEHGGRYRDRGDHYYRRGSYGGYDPYRHDGYRYSRRGYDGPRITVHYHGRQRCSRRHSSFYFGW